MDPEQKTLTVLVHEHRHGTTVAPFRSQKSYQGMYNSNENDMSQFEELFQKLDIEYSDGEYIEFFQIPETQIKNLD